MERWPSMYHQSPPGSRRTCGTRSAIGPAVTRSVHRSGGSMMWESDEIIMVVVMVLLCGV